MYPIVYCHILYTSQKCTKLIHALSRSAKMNWGLSSKALHTIYKGAILPLMIYSVPVWIKALEKEHNRVSKIYFTVNSYLQVPNFCTCSSILFFRYTAIALISFLFLLVISIAFDLFSLNFILLFLAHLFIFPISIFTRFSASFIVSAFTASITSSAKAYHFCLFLVFQV